MLVINSLDYEWEYLRSFGLPLTHIFVFSMYIVSGNCGERTGKEHQEKMTSLTVQMLPHDAVTL